MKSEHKIRSLESLLNSLRNDEVSSLQDFIETQKPEVNFFQKVDFAHEFLDLLTFKIKESKSSMDKDLLAKFSLDFLRQSLKEYGYNPKFVAVQCKALITYYQNQKNIDHAIEVSEFLIKNGITDDDAKGFHFRLDELYRLKKKIEDKALSLDDIVFAKEEDDD